VSSRPVSPRRVWVMAALVLALTFVAGALAGAAWERVRGAPERPRSSTSRGDRPLSAVMQERYGLTGEQTKRVDAILQRRRPRVDSLMSTVRPQLLAAFDSTNREIRQLLSPEQRVKFDQDRERRRRSLAGTSRPPAAPAPAPAPASP
jgi:hypothetical protein